MDYTKVYAHSGKQRAVLLFLCFLSGVAVGGLSKQSRNMQGVGRLSGILIVDYGEKTN